MNMRIPQPTEEQLERLIGSTIRSLNGIKNEETNSLKVIELRAAQAKLERIEEYLKNLQERNIRIGKGE